MKEILSASAELLHHFSPLSASYGTVPDSLLPHLGLSPAPLPPTYIQDVESSVESEEELEEVEEPVLPPNPFLGFELRTPLSLSPRELLIEDSASHDTLASVFTACFLSFHRLGRRILEARIANANQAQQTHEEEGSDLEVKSEPVEESPARAHPWKKEFRFSLKV